MQTKSISEAENLYRWGYWCAYGNPRKKDRKKAFEYWNRAAHLGHVLAQFYLGTCYDRGIGTSRNLKLAKKWYEKTARLGVMGGQFNLAFMYRDGIAVRKDLRK